LEGDLGALDGAFRLLGAQWQGAAADSAMSAYSRWHADMAEDIDILDQAVGVLAEAREEYAEAERAAQRRWSW
jgi:WXG100 family type VII secretion target